MIFHFGRAGLRPVVLMFVLLAAIPAHGQETAVRQAQDTLVSWGYLSSPSDGVMGPATRSALRAFQRNTGLAVTGDLDAATARALSIKLPAPVSVPSAEAVPSQAPPPIPDDEAETARRSETTIAPTPQITSVAQPSTHAQQALPAENDKPAFVAILLAIAALLFVVWLGIRFTLWLWAAITAPFRRDEPPSVYVEPKIAEAPRASARPTPSAQLSPAPPLVAPGKPASHREKRPAARSGWIPKGESVSVAGRNIGGMVYVGVAPKVSYGQPENAFIDPSKTVAQRGTDRHGDELSYWPNYSEISARGRATYLGWLAGGRDDPSYDAGYMFLYFYGLERRFFVDAPPDFERREIVVEVQRLYALFTHNNSAERYLSTFLEAAALVIAPQAETVPDVSRGRGELPLDLKVALGRKLDAGTPLTAEWLRAWYLADPETKLRTPARRCRSEFEALFDVLFKQRYPDGLTIKPPKRTIKANYRAASRTFEADITELIGDVPDVSTIRKPMSIAGTIGEEAMTALDGLSRLLGKDPQARGTLSAHALLPASIRAAFPCAEGDGLRDWARGIVGQGGTVPAVDLLERLNGVRPDRLSRKALTTGSDALGTLGIGMAPDPRFALRAPRLGEPVVLFELPDGASLEVSERFGETALRLGLATMIAQADGTVEPSEKTAIDAIIAETPDLSEAERLRLTATARWMREVPPDMTLLRKRAKNAPDEGKAALGRMALEMANADGQVMPEELKQIEKVYKLLDLDSATIYSDLHAIAATGDDPVMVRPASTGRQGSAIPPEPKAGSVALDTARISAIRKDTKDVSTLLAGIFSGDDESDDDDSAAPPEILEVSENLGGLSAAQTAFARELATQDHWTEAAFETLASRHGLMSAGALETLNEWSFSTYDRAYLDEYEGYDVDPEIAADIGE